VQRSIELIQTLCNDRLDMEAIFYSMNSFLDSYISVRMPFLYLLLFVIQRLSYRVFGKSI
jgi:hypothetical protein